MQETQETWVQTLGQEDALESEMATHFHSCLENSMDKRAWWITVHGATKSWTGLNTYAHMHACKYMPTSPGTIFL